MENSFAGDLWNNFPAVIERVNLGLKAVANAQAHVKARAKCDEVFGTGMTKVAKADTFDEKGSAGAAWRSLKGHLETVGKHHVEIAGNLNKKLLTDMTEFEKEKKKQLANLQAEAAKIQKDLDKAKADNLKAKQKFEKLSREADKTEEGWEKKDADPKVQVPVLDKMYAKWQSLKESVATADEEYKKSIEDVNSMQKQFQDEMARILAELEKSEEERIDFTRGLFLGFFDTLEENLKAVVDSIDEVRKSVAAIDNRADLNAFVIDKKIEGDRPEDVQYEPYESLFQQDHRSRIGPASIDDHPPPEKKAKAPKKAKKGKAADADDFSDSGSGSAAASTAVASEPVSSGISKKAKAQFPFDGEDGELSFAADDIITVTNIVDGGWWEGTLNGKSGSFPGNYVVLMDDDSAPAPAGGVAAPAAAAAEPAAAEPAPAAADDAGEEKKKCKVLYAYKADGADELSCAEDEVLTVDRAVGEWLVCVNAKGESGMVPRNYVQVDE